MKKLRTPQHHHQFMTCQDDIIWLGSCSRCWFFKRLLNSSILLLSSGCGWIWSSRSRTFFPSLSIYKNEWKLRWENWIGLVLSSAVLCFPRLSLKCEFLTEAVDKQTTKRLCFLFSIPPAVAVHDDFLTDCSRWPWKSTFLRISTNARWTKGWIKDECCVAGNGITQSSRNQRNVDDDGQQRQRRFNLAQQWWCGRLFNSQQTNIATTEIIDLGSNIIRNPHIPGLHIDHRSDWSVFNCCCWWFCWTVPNVSRKLKAQMVEISYFPSVLRLLLSLLHFTARLCLVGGGPGKSNHISAYRQSI